MLDRTGRTPGGWAALAVALAVGAQTLEAQRPTEASATVVATATIVAPMTVEARSLALTPGAAGEAWIEADVAVRGPSPHALAVVVAGRDGSARWAWERVAGTADGSPGEARATEVGEAVPAAGRPVTRSLSVDEGAGVDGLRVSYVVAVLY